MDQRVTVSAKIRLAWTINEMGLALRLLVVDQSDHIYRLGIAKFDEMSRNPRGNPYPEFATQRIRAAEAVVELVNRKAVGLVRMTFDILTFDQSGCFSRETFERQQFSRFEAGILPSLRPADLRSQVVEASSLFTSRGGRWVPSETLERALQDAALGRVKCPHLGTRAASSPE